MPSRRIWPATVVVPLMLAVVSAHADAAKTGSWGDQGDGTYKNPILNADYPDVDVEQLGDTYYMISSKQHMSPGMAFLESKDMVNWRSIGHVWDKLVWDPKYNGDRMDGYKFGVWAGDLARHDGKWYCYQIDTTNGLYISSAEDIRGPWTKPHLMLKKTRWTDPAVCWDDDARQAYLVCNFGGGGHRGGAVVEGNQIKLFKMSWDGRELLDEGVVIHRGPGAEAAKIYRVDGRWYIFLAQWFRPDPRPPDDPQADKGDRKQLVLRSKTDSIYGPYEEKVVFERGNGVIRSCSQGALMQAPDGSWWCTHQLIQNIPAPFQGRPQMLEPVQWIDGWPIIGEDVDGDGIGEPVLRHAKPIQGFPITAPATDDEFDSPKLGPQWEWNHNPIDSHWSLTERPGWLRLKASVPVGQGGFWGASNTISQRIMGTGKGEATAKFDLSAVRPGQRAGFVRFGGVYYLLGIDAGEDGSRRLFFDADGQITAGPVVDADTLWVRTTNDGDQARFSWSTDGRTFRDFGPTFTLKFGKWTGDRLGFFCFTSKADAGHIDVDWFHYDYDGPKGQPDAVRAATAERPNVLFIAVDDLRPELGCYGRKLVKTPNIDRLAVRGVCFTRAYCQQAICGPSRASLMTGLRPDSSGVTHNMTYFRDTVPDVITLPQHFREHGYETVYIGKVYHAQMRDEEKSWSRKAVFPRREYPLAVGGYRLPENQQTVRRKQAETKAKFGQVALGGMDCGPAVEAADVLDAAYQDGYDADAAVLTLRQLAGRPFFLAVGFYKPHLPFVAPKRYWDLYDPREIQLAGNPFAPQGAPSIGLHSSFELRTREGIPKWGPIPDDQARELIHGYLACASYVDAQVGKILDELDRLGLADKTVILLWGDHGWHLGEHGIWGKATDYEIATRVPLIASAPGRKARGATSGGLVELVDMYPTLCELAGLPLPEHLEGASFAPLLDNPNRAWKSAAFSQFPCPALREWAALPLSEPMRQTFFGPLVREAERKLQAESPNRFSRQLYENYVTGYTMRTDRYRLVRWVDVRDRQAQPVAVELYDTAQDSQQNVNLAGDPANAGLIKELTEKLNAGWRAALPP